MKPTETAPPAPIHQRWRWLAVLVFVAGLWGLVEITGLRQQISLQAVREGFAQHRLWGLAAFTALFVLANLAHIPGAFFLAAAVLALGPVWGALTTYVAACIACTVTFVVVRALGADALRELDNRLARRLFAKLDAHPVRSVVMLRTVFHSVSALNYTLALSGVSLRDYVIGTLLGLPLPILVVTALFDTLAVWMGWATH
ncbi:putative membrane protein YdjX (TVP38/TMEM64 family) [Pelomonas saccharophila]|uniref:TVP38/TMEM64 family membrane protein n=1 Tax=Roseateles saccharophilus TaxID=304 RepID=A0ABU1YUY7_ROSSA|nr:VTT domain-containing protein [Roseateles saccharophilus]MDR7272672.1 putative membrane protein YdjX (TVP38/TMEM64 family) [Roseateles saccharophilus]